LSYTRTLPFINLFNNINFSLMDCKPF